MYEKAMTGIASHLIQRSLVANLIYTAELVPERMQSGDLSVY
jgi:hypothetical protein